jgi:hypothetical protein
MKIIREITDDEMISVFLKAEINSDRFGPTVLSFLQKYNLNRGIVDNPNIENREDNEQRRKLLGEFRGYRNNLYIFQDFPSDIKWFRAFLTKDELSKVLYINWDYWVEETKGTRLPQDLVKRIETKDLPEDKEVLRFRQVAESIKSGVKLPELIIVSEDEHSKLVVVEGHVRLTSYFLIPEMIKEETEVIVGFSKDIRNWENY